jgi:hypothetical protein
MTRERDHSFCDFASLSLAIQAQPLFAVRGRDLGLFRDSCFGCCHVSRSHRRVSLQRLVDSCRGVIARTSMLIARLSLKAIAIYISRRWPMSCNVLRTFSEFNKTFSLMLDSLASHCLQVATSSHAKLRRFLTLTPTSKLETFTSFLKCFASLRNLLLRAL